MDEPVKMPSEVDKSDLLVAVGGGTTLEPATATTLLRDAHRVCYAKIGC